MESRVPLPGGGMPGVGGLEGGGGGGRVRAACLPLSSPAVKAKRPVLAESGSPYVSPQAPCVSIVVIGLQFVRSFAISYSPIN